MEPEESSLTEKQKEAIQTVLNGHRIAILREVSIIFAKIEKFTRMRMLVPYAATQMRRTQICDFIETNRGVKPDDKLPP